MTPPFDAAQEALDGANQATTILGAITGNITQLQQRIDSLGNDLRAAQEETSNAQEEARSMREEVMSARQEIQRLNSQLESEKASNKSLRERLRDLGNRVSGLQDTFRAGCEAFFTIYQRAQELVVDTNDTGIDEPEATSTLATASPTEPPLTSSSTPVRSTPTSPASNLSSLAEAPTPSASTRSTPSTRDTNSAGSIPSNSAQATGVAPTSRTVATVDCYAVVALESEDPGVSLFTQSTAYSSLVTKPAQKFGPKTWRVQDVSDDLKRNIESWGHKDLSQVSQILLECAHSGTSGVIYEATNVEQISGVTIAATNLAIQVGESHEYIDHLAEQDRRGSICPSVVVVTSSGELAKWVSINFAGLINGESNNGSAIESIRVFHSTGGDDKGLANFKTNIPTIFVCTPGRLAEFIRYQRFSARLLHLLVVFQGPSLASADSADTMQRIIAWARCERSSSTGTRPASTPAPCPLTTIVLSRSFERDCTLHQELQQRYLDEFIRTTNVTRFELGKQPLLAFQGKIKVETRAFGVPARSKHFVEQILPLHEDESILCMEFSRDRATKFASQCDELGVSCQVFTTEPDNPMTMQHFRTGECKITFSTPAGFECIRYKNTKTAVVFASPCQSHYTNADGSPRPGVYNRRTDLLRAAIESIGKAGTDATVYIFVGQGTAQPVKDDIAKVLGQAGYEIPSVLKPRPRWW
ncbi:hypothetical protein KCU95_g5257, partial [Aureobasidium melanogenum]